MEYIDIILDAVFLIILITCTILVIINRNRFDLWAALLTCAAMILKGVRRICYDLVSFNLDALLNAGKGNDILLFMKIASVILRGIDTLVYLLLIAVLIRLMLIGLYSRWYNKAKNVLRK